MKSVKVTAGRWWLIGIVFSGGLLLAAALRYGILENDALDQICQGAANGWCTAQSVLGWSIHYELFGLGGLVLGLVAWVPGARWLALPALLLGGCGLLIYNTTYAAVAAVVALLAALRPTASANR